MNWLLRPWITPKLELTALDEIVGCIEVLVGIILFVVIWVSVREYLHKWR